MHRLAQRDAPREEQQEGYHREEQQEGYLPGQQEGYLPGQQEEHRGASGHRCARWETNFKMFLPSPRTVGDQL